MRAHLSIGALFRHFAKDRFFVLSELVNITAVIEEAGDPASSFAKLLVEKFSQKVYW